MGNITYHQRPSLLLVAGEHGGEVMVGGGDQRIHKIPHALHEVNDLDLDDKVEAEAEVVVIWVFTIGLGWVGLDGVRLD